MQWLAENRRSLIDAEFALNEGGGGTTDGKGKLASQEVQVGEKTFVNFRLETRNAGGHSSVRIRDNAIYQLARALTGIDEFEFPLELNDTTRAYFARAGAARHDAMGQAMVAIVANPADRIAEQLLNSDRNFHSMLRTTCVATLLDAGHAANALPQRANANVNCRIFPGHSIEETQAVLARVIGDPGVSIAALLPARPQTAVPPLDPAIIGPMEKLAEHYFPGVPLVPLMATGYTDATFLGAAGIPTYGVPGSWYDPDGNGTHGLDERIEVRSVFVGRDYLFDLIKAYAE